MQNLDIEARLSVLEYMVRWIRTVPVIDEIALGISEGADNHCFAEFAKKHDIPFIFGDETDVLGRLIQCAEKCAATDIFRLTTESPFTCFEYITDAWKRHVQDDYDFTCLDHVPDGCGFEIIRLKAYKMSHVQGEDRHRTELCSLYIRENKEKFKIQYVDAPAHLRRKDIRLTIDYPEDLILCRAVYKHFKDKAPLIPVGEIIEYLDANPGLKELVRPFVEEGLKTMYL